MVHSDIFWAESHIPTDTVRCDDSSGGLQFFLVKQIHKAHFGNIGEGGSNVHAFHV